MTEDEWALTRHAIRNLSDAELARQLAGLAHLDPTHLDLDVRLHLLAMRHEKWRRDLIKADPPRG